MYNNEIMDDNVYILIGICLIMEHWNKKFFFKKKKKKKKKWKIYITMNLLWHLIFNINKLDGFVFIIEQKINYWWMYVKSIF